MGYGVNRERYLQGRELIAARVDPFELAYYCTLDRRKYPKDHGILRLGLSFLRNRFHQETQEFALAFSPVDHVVALLEYISQVKI